MKKKTIQEDLLKAARRQSRQEDIASHGKQTVFRTTVTKSGKIYDRNRKKREAKDNIQ